MYASILACDLNYGGHHYYSCLYILTVRYRSKHITKNRTQTHLQKNLNIKNNLKDLIIITCSLCSALPLLQASCFEFCTMRLVITFQTVCYFSSQDICRLLPPPFPSHCAEQLCTLCTIIGISCVLSARLLLILVVQLHLLGLVGLGVEYLSCRCVLCRRIGWSRRGLVLHASVTCGWSLITSTESMCYPDRVDVFICYSLQSLYFHKGWLKTVKIQLLVLSKLLKQYFVTRYVCSLRTGRCVFFNVFKRAL